MYILFSKPAQNTVHEVKDIFIENCNGLVISLWYFFTVPYVRQIVYIWESPNIYKSYKYKTSLSPPRYFCFTKHKVSYLKILQHNFTVRQHNLAASKWVIGDLRPIHPSLLCFCIEIRRILDKGVATARSCRHWQFDGLQAD